MRDALEDFVKTVLAGISMVGLPLALPIFIAAMASSCAGKVRAACTRYADGRIECGIEYHADGRHDRPVRPEEEKSK